MVQMQIETGHWRDFKWSAKGTKAVWGRVMVQSQPAFMKCGSSPKKMVFNDRHVCMLSSQDTPKLLSFKSRTPIAVPTGMLLEMDQLLQLKYLSLFLPLLYTGSRINSESCFTWITLHRTRNYTDRGKLWHDFWIHRRSEADNLNCLKTSDSSTSHDHCAHSSNITRTFTNLRTESNVFETSLAAHAQITFSEPIIPLDSNPRLKNIRLSGPRAYFLRSSVISIVITETTVYHTALNNFRSSRWHKWWPRQQQGKFMASL